MLLKIFLYFCASGAWAQRPNFANDLDKLFSVARIGTFDDSSPCPCASLCVNNATASECPSGRVVQRPECECCFSCAKQAGEPCDNVNGLCDSDRGLHCGPRRICEPKEPCRNDRDCTSDKLCFGGACANPCKLFNPCARSLPSGVCTTRDHRPVCSCAKGFENRGGVCIRTAPEEKQCIHEGKRYEIGQSFNTRNCTEKCLCRADGSFFCEPISCPRGFFRQGLNQDNLCYEEVEPDAPDCCVRIVCESSSALEEEIAYYDEEPNGEFPTPSQSFNATSLDETNDQVRFPSSQESDGPIHLMATERSLSSISLVWDDQVTDGRNYVIEYRPRGNQTWQVSPASTGNSLALSNLRPSTEYEIRLAVMDSLARKTVPLSDDIVVSTDAGCYDDGTVYPADTTFTKGCDSNCTCDLSGQLSCFPRCSAPFYRSGTFASDELCRENPTSDSCCVIVQCAASVDDSADEVIMKANDDEGSESCLFKNQTYLRGEKFFDGCEYSCECDQNAEILCKPRCAPLPDVREPGCDVIPDPVDECCLMIACNKDQVAPTTTTKSSIVSDGCIFKGATYRRGETFLDGCEQRCQCLGFGDIECTTRCPPLGHFGSGDCTVKQDPNDPCCSVLVCNSNKTEETTIAEVNPTTVPVTTIAPSETTITVVKFDIGDAKTVKLDFSTTIVTTPSPSTSSVVKKPPKIEKVDLVDNQRIAVRFAVDTEELANIKAIPGYVRVLRSVDLEKWESEDINPLDVVQDADKPKQVGVEIPISRGEQEVYLRLELGGNSSNTIAVETKATGIPREGTGCLADGIIPVGSNYTDGCGQRCHCADNGRAICDYSCEPDQKSDCPNVQRCNLYEERRVRKSAENENGFGNSKFADLEDNQFEGGRFPLIDKLLKQMNKDKGDAAETREEPSVDALDEIINEDPAQNLSEPAEPGFCSYKGKLHKAGEEFYDGCKSLCSCNEDGTVDCAAIECPTDFGLDLINPNCLDWEHQNSSREPPNCCSEPKCLNDGSCMYNGEKFRNFDELPESVTGCEKRCYCEFGNVTCSARCPPVVALAPRNLPCDPSEAVIDYLPSDRCCKYWQCRSDTDRIEKTEKPLATEIQTPFGIQTSQQNAKQITNLTATALDFSTVEVEFNIPTLFVGLHGYSEVLFRLLGFGGDFESKEFREPDGTFSEVHQRHLLHNLREDAIYELKVRAHLELGGNSEPVESELVRVETPFNPALFEDSDVSPSEVTSTTSAPAPSPAVSHHPSKMVVDAELKAVDLKPNEATIQWRNFEQNERQLIDGIQLRYKNLDVNAQVFTMTNLLHRDVTSYKLEELMPSTMYEVDIIFMPFENQVIELISDKPIRFKTLNIEDPYNFNISLSTTRVSEMSTDLNWTGVPYPEDKYVSIYRVLFQGDGDPDTAAAFKLAKHDAPSSMTVKELKPGHRYRFWIEAYLTNGKVKTSNVIDVITKPGPVPKLALAGAGPVHSSQLREGESSDQGYFLAVVILAVVAGCALLMVLILSVVLARRGTKATATITARKSQSAYDNPSYKNYEAADANGHRNKNLNDAL